jgi:hypothetical protein
VVKATGKDTKDKTNREIEEASEEVFNREITERYPGRLH